MLLGAVPADGVPEGVLASLGMLLLEPLEEGDADGDIDPDVDGELVLPDGDIGVVLEPVDPPPAPAAPPADPDAALLPLVVFDMLELSVFGAGGSVF